MSSSQTRSPDFRARAGVYDELRPGIPGLDEALVDGRGLAGRGLRWPMNNANAAASAAKLVIPPNARKRTLPGRGASARARICVWRDGSSSPGEAAARRDSTSAISGDCTRVA